VVEDASFLANDHRSGHSEHAGQEQSGEKDRALQVHSKEPLYLGGSHAGEVTGAEYSGVVDQHVDRSVFSFRPGH